MKKVTKKAVNLAIKEKNTTEIFRLAYLSGIDTSKKNEVLNFAVKNCKYSNAFKKCYSIVYCGKKNYCYIPYIQLVTTNSIRIAKLQNRSSPYCKILIKGFRHWYWASPVYQHSDYNKSIAFPVNDFNNKLAILLNSIIK